MFNGKYLDWNHRKIKTIISHFGFEHFHNIKVIDLGAGHGDIGASLYRLGSDVTCVDAREEHLKVAAKKFPGIKTVKADLDVNWPFQNKPVDLILDLDLICHLKDFEKHLNNVCGSCNQLVIETAVADSDDPNFVQVLSENKSIYDWSYNGFSSFPTAAAIEKILNNNGMSFTRFDNKIMNSGTYVYDWQVSNSKECSYNKRRLWFAKKIDGQTLPVIHSVAPILTPIDPVFGFRKLDPALVVQNQVSNKKIDELSSPITSIQLPYRPIHDTSKPRIALCLSGYMRTFEQTYDLLWRNVLTKLNCDVFIHTWDTLGNPRNPSDSRVSNLGTSMFEAKINNFYSPKKMMIEPAKEFTITDLMKRKNISHDTKNVLSMYYGVKLCTLLKSEYEKENNFQYDCVIRARTDLSFHKPFELSKSINFNQVFFPKYGDYGGYNDQFAFSNSDNMNIYATLFDNIQSYLAEGCVFNPEVLLKYHINKNNLPVARSTVNYTVLRPNGSVLDNFDLEKSFGFLPPNAVNLLHVLPDDAPTDSPIIKKNIADLKVAICLSGHLRTFEETAPSLLRNVIEPSNADVFIHTWDTLGFDPGRGDSHSVNLKTEDYLDKINATFSPKKIVIEKFFQQNKDKYTERVRDTRDPANVLGMFYKIKKCNEIKQQYEIDNNFKYDVVIRCRADLNIDTKLFVLDFLDTDGNIIWLPKFDYFLGNNDKFAFGSSETMDKYSTCINNIPLYYDSGCIFNAEAIMKAHLDYLKLKIKRCDLQYTVVRIDGFKFSNT